MGLHNACADTFVSRSARHSSIARLTRRGALVAVMMLLPGIVVGQANAAAELPQAPSFDHDASKPGMRAVAPPDGADHSVLDRQAALMPAAQRLAREVSSSGSDLAGVRIDAEAGVLHVYTTDTKRFLGLGASLPAGTDMRLHRAEFSHAAMISAVDRVQNGAKLLSQQENIKVAGAGVNEDGSGITVAVLATAANSSATLERASQILHDRYGDIVSQVDVTTTTPSADDQYFMNARFNNFAPWYGGDRIRAGSQGCTTGFEATFGGNPAMLTAAHCGGVGTTFNHGPGAADKYTVMGTSVYSNLDTDIGVIKVSATSSYINIGADPQFPTQLFVSWWASPVVGEWLCASGSFTGERCNLKVVTTNQSKCRAWSSQGWCIGWKNPLADVINMLGPDKMSVGTGDSGGPVYLKSSLYAVAKGLVNGPMTPTGAADYPAYAPTGQWCSAPEGWGWRCSSGFSFAHMPGY
jgi:Trypsin